MEFGKVTVEELEDVDFTLPPDHPQTTSILKKAPSPDPKIFVGCAKWGRKDWVGKIYPKGTKEANFLNHYARHFNCIELNATFYRMPKRTQIAAWKKKVTPDRFEDAISGFEDALGPVSLMPHPTFGPKNIDILRNFIQDFPKDISLFTELRGLHPTDYSRIDAWVQRIKKWKEEGIHTVYFFMHQHEEIHSPELSRYLIQQLNKHCGTSIPEPQIAEEQSLFN